MSGIRLSPDYQSDSDSDEPHSAAEISEFDI